MKEQKLSLWWTGELRGDDSAAEVARILCRPLQRFVKVFKGLAKTFYGQCVTMAVVYQM